MKPPSLFLGLLGATLLAASALPTFTGSDQGIPGAEVRWGDFDSDGNLDFVVNGLSGSRFVRVYRGNGSGGFTLDTNSNSILGLTEGPTLGGDFDNDGDLDLAIAGWGGTTYSRIYRSDGTSPANSWTELPLGLRGLKGSDGAWFDFDHDGDLDLLLTGESYDTGMADYTLIYRNDGGGNFTQAVSLLGTYVGGASVGDFDHDGDIDIALTGRTAGSIVYANNGSGGFTNLGALGLPPLQNSAIAWGDYDNDGDLDLALSGNFGAALQADIYTNHNGSFTALNSGIAPIRLGTLTWGDYDNDGFPDLLIVGSDNDPALNPLAFLYRNNGNGTFTDAAVGLTPVSNQSSADWGDFDNDGDLDIILAGDVSIGTLVVKVFKNESTLANTAPTAPTGLVASVIGSKATLSWSASSDLETPAAGLTYNLRVGTTSGGQQIMAPMSNLTTGRRRIPARGNAQQNLSWSLRNFSPGIYYCSVQAIDNGYLASGWSSETSFTIAPPGSPPSSFTRISPASGAIGVATRPTFTWNSAAGATSYTLEISTDSGFASIAVAQAGIAGTSFTPASALSAGTVYYWRVSAVNGAGATFASGAPYSLTTLTPVDILVAEGCGLLGLELLVLLLALRRRTAS